MPSDSGSPRSSRIAFDAAGNALAVLDEDAQHLHVCTPGGVRLSVPVALLRTRDDGSLHLPLVVHGSRQAAAATIPVLEERLHVGKRVVDAGGVRIDKSVDLRDEHVALALGSEHVEVDRVAHNTVVSADKPPRMREEGGTLIIPVLEERLVVSKQLVLKEELHVRRRREERIERHTETLRSEHVEVTRTERKQPSAQARPMQSTPSCSRGRVPHGRNFMEEIMQHTIIGVFDDLSQAKSAMSELIAAGFGRDRVHLNPHTESTSAGSGESGIGHFFRSLFGMEHEDEHRSHESIYTEAARRGSSVLTVDAENDTERDRAVAIMQRHSPVDLDKRAAQWRSEGWTGYQAGTSQLGASQSGATQSGASQSGTSRSATSRTGTSQTGANQTGTSRTARTREAEQDETIRVPIIEEQMKVGKRTVDHGGIRVVQHITQKPVHESVDLRKESIDVERHGVNRPASEADLAAFKEGSIEIRDRDEEPVVSKEARVVEEVEIGKHVTHEQADIDDTVRRTEVEVQRMQGDGDTRATGDDADFRNHWQSVYGRNGGKYEEFDSAYRYGSSVGGDERFKDSRWEDAEPQLQRDWEASHPGSTWERVKDAVRYGAERSTHRGRGMH